MAAHDDDLTEGSIPLLEMEPSSREPITSKRRAQPSSPFRFLLATALLVVGGLGAFYVWTHGRPAYQTYSRARQPHHKQVHVPTGTVAKETELVRPMFGRAREGGVVKFDLVASIYFKGQDYGNLDDLDDAEDDVVELPPTMEPGLNDSNSTAANSSSISSQPFALTVGRGSRMLGKGGRISMEGWTSPPEPEWERVFSEPVMRELDVSASRNAVVNVVLPDNVVRLIRKGDWSTHLEAAFHLVPSSTTLPFFVANTTQYMQNRRTSALEDFRRPLGSHPLPYPAVGRNVSEQKDLDQPWESRVQGAPSFGMLRRVFPLGGHSFVLDAEDETAKLELDDAGIEGDDDELDLDWLEGNTTEQRSPRVPGGSGRTATTVLIKRSMVTLIDRSPVYSLKKFKRKMRELRVTQEECGNRGYYRKCDRTFTNKGHFERLMRIASTEPAIVGTNAPQTVGWRYPPFLLANFGKTGPRDHINMTAGAGKGDGDDFSFDWHVSFAPISPVKAALAEKYYNEATSEVPSSGFFGGPQLFFGMPVVEEAREQDLAELRSALMGHSFSHNSHPILRLISLNLGKLASLASTILTAYFWYSRILTTGISVPAHAIDTLVRFVAFGAGVVSRGDKKDWMMTPVVVLISGLVWSLCARLEWVGGGPKEMVLVGVRRRRATKGERASAREDGKFAWLLRAGVFTLASELLIWFIVPPLISASHPMPRPMSRVSKIPRSIVQGSAAHLVVSQLHLNHRLRSFGGSYRLVAFFDLASSVFAVLPVALSGWWGRWETMPAFGAVEMVWVAGRAALAWQAWECPRVEQTESEEE